MTTYTDKEMAMLKVFYNASIECCGSCDDEENMSYCNAKDLQAELGGSMQEIGGVMSSLESKGAITDTGESPRGSHLNDFILSDISAAA